MAAQALTHIGMEPAKGMLRVVGIYSGWLPDLSVSETQTTSAKPRSTYRSVAVGLGCAKGAMMALGIEIAAAAAVILIYGLWRY